MNRIIKFRVWDTIGKRFVNQDEKSTYPYFLIDLNGKIALFDDDNLEVDFYSSDGKTTEEQYKRQIPLGDRFIVQQFTGLTDSNGTEIYEGDIVKGKFNIDEVEDWMWLNLTDKEIETAEKLFEIKIPEVYQNAMPDDLEIIGNIYENPELL